MAHQKFTVHLVDGTYELFRQFYGRPTHTNKSGQEVGAVRGVVASTLQLIEEGATHIGIATDHVIESFRNDLWDGYKTGDGIDPILWSQFHLLEDALTVFGFKVWATTDLEADDALASAAHVAKADSRVAKAVILTPDKDLAQCVVDDRVVQLDRRNQKLFDEAAVFEKFGVSPASIPDYLALVGDNADGFPGIKGFGAKTSAALLREYIHIENVPLEDVRSHEVKIIKPALLNTLRQNVDQALLFKELATLRIDEKVLPNIDDLLWRGPTNDAQQFAELLENPRLFQRAQRASNNL